VEGERSSQRKELYFSFRRKKKKKSPAKKGLFRLGLEKRCRRVTNSKEGGAKRKKNSDHERKKDLSTPTLIKKKMARPGANHIGERTLPEKGRG